jgi:DNA-binding NtrC family response regulator
VDEGGRVSWFNAMAAALLGVSHADARQFKAEELLGCNLEQVLARTLARTPQPLLLPNGLTVWMLAEYRDLGDGDDDEPRADAEMPPPPAAGPAIDAGADESATGATTLAHVSRQLIEQTLAQCQGNVSLAARRLGVSRGLLYRRLRNGR